MPANTASLQNHIDTLQHQSSKYTLIRYVNQDEEEGEKEDFPTVSLDDEHWNTEKIPDRHLCIHEHSLPHGLCPYPCQYWDYMTSLYYDTLDLSDIVEFEDLMTTSSDEDIPALDEVDTEAYGLWLEINIHIYMNFKILFLFNL